MSRSRLFRKSFLFLAFACLVLACGELETGVVGSELTPQQEIELLAREFSPEGSLGPNDQLVFVDFDGQTATTKSGRVPLPPMEVRAQAIEDDPLPQDDDFRRVATRFGTAEQPMTKIRAILVLPEASELKWLEDCPQDAAFNYFGILTRGGTKADFGLQSTIIDGVPAGTWYPFINLFPGPGSDREFQAWKEFTIPEGTRVVMELEAVADAKPSVPGEFPGLILRVLSFDSTFVLVMVGGNVSNVKLDGVDQALRRVTSLVTISRNPKARMCGTFWEDTVVGKDEALQRLDESNAALQPDGNLELVESTEGTVIRDNVAYYTERVDLRCPSVALVIDITGSMQPEIDAIKAALDTMIISGLGQKISTWFQIIFDDLSIFRGQTSSIDEIRDWVAEIVVGGGGDCIESSLAAVNLGKEFLRFFSSDRGERHIVLVTDATPRMYPLDQLEADLLDNGVKLHVLLTGECFFPSATTTATAAAVEQLDAQATFSHLAEVTGGQYFYIPDGGPEDFEVALEQIFTSIAVGSTDGPPPPPPSDTEPPTLNVAASPEFLWPPNHKLVEIDVQAVATDNEDPNPVVELVSVQVHENGEVREGADVAEDVVISEDGAIWLRAERGGGSSEGRTYRILYKATDSSGNTAEETVDVIVPHDKRK